MIVKLQIPWKKIIKDLRVSFLFIVVYMSAISVIDYFYPLEEIHVPLTLITVPGTVIALLLGFRTNSAYDRWWEARIIWGAIVNDSRTWVRQLMTFIKYESKSSAEFDAIRKMALRHVAWNYSLARQLRKHDPIQDLKKLVDNNEIKLLRQKQNVSNAILYMQAEEIKRLYESGWLDKYQFVQLDGTLSRLTDSMGKCERIKNTVFPASYSLLVDLLIYLWIFFLPFGLVDMIGLILIPTTISLAFSFLVIEKVAIFMQDPFENQPTDTPMLALSRTIEINIMQELGEQEIPQPILPVHGVLM
ncbi:MAG: hypothetical protein MI975_14380 [Cytophagales bacterium]|nr:hypothetical protein [Cytophagales bacterium]